MPFFVFIPFLSVFSTNAINIFAGVNGLAAGQSVVFVLSALTLNIVQSHRIPQVYVEDQEDHAHLMFSMISSLAVGIAWRSLPPRAVLCESSADQLTRIGLFGLVSQP